MLKRFFNYFKRLRYKCTETYYIKAEYVYKKEVQDFLNYRRNILDKINCKFELITDFEFTLGDDEIGKVILTHPKCSVTSNAVLALRNGEIFWIFID